MFITTLYYDLICDLFLHHQMWFTKYVINNIIDFSMIINLHSKRFEKLSKWWICYINYISTNMIIWVESCYNELKNKLLFGSIYIITWNRIHAQRFSVIHSSFFGYFVILRRKVQNLTFMDWWLIDDDLTLHAAIQEL